MKTRLISHNESNSRLILIFAGWSTDPDFYLGLEAPGWDIMVVYDYADLSLDASPLRGYSTVFLVAWSLGVAAAAHAAAAVPEIAGVTAAFAVNGTLHPVDDSKGIPLDIFNGTEATLSPRNLTRFRRRMSSARDLYQLPADYIASAEKLASEAYIYHLRRELRSIRDDAHPGQLPWRRVYISESDRIFPRQAQLNAWSGLQPDAPQIITLNAGHYIPLQRIITEITPDYERIGRRFAVSIATYDHHAVAQEKIASRVASLLRDTLAARQSTLPSASASVSLLEIGPGSGRLTSKIAEFLTPDKATFVDLYKVGPFNLAANEAYYQGDAEEWMETHRQMKFDIIISASTIQWFVNPARFFQNAVQMLNPGGLLVCSSFIKGNLAELDALRPAPLLYHSADEMRAMIPAELTTLLTDTEDIILTFSSPREALLHLKLTGVGGGSRSLTRHLLTALPSAPTLTYRPIYILARK